ncbi:MAG: homoprotocatechuate degradation operon regulator HpaR [Pseudolabrys sp.]|nr:homoprotocatechuate degradation operon regulator HpaR [Pseudolabrys sp.]MCW5683290.1 homoprotocatechuate degradation operon regulator HpaR [Pseudolabrys sp.]
MQLMRAREAVMARFRPHLKARDLSDQQWRIIRALSETNSLEIVALSACCCIHPASLSRMLPALEQEGLIKRQGHVRDQRRSVISLTVHGRRLFREMGPESEAIYAALARDIGTARLSQLYAMLDALIATLEQPAIVNRKMGLRKTRVAKVASRARSARSKR